MPAELARCPEVHPLPSGAPGLFLGLGLFVNAGVTNARALGGSLRLGGDVVVAQCLGGCFGNVELERASGASQVNDEGVQRGDSQSSVVFLLTRPWR